MLRDYKGFMLLEIMLSLLILGVVLVMCTQVIAGFIRSGASSLNTTQASALAARLLGEIEANKYVLGSRTGNFEDSPGFSYEVNKSKVDYNFSQYKYSIKWIEHGTEKNAQFTLQKFEP
ncbi:MAG: hypothetical protein LHV68_06450 [Elusimicrobia bacterium]|nr:hypothetical protein [Candidatus Liberimonas magnetica]